MNLPPDSASPAAEVLALCDALIDGQLTSEQHARLEALVRHDAAARRAYVEYLHLHSALRDLARADQPKSLADIMAMPLSDAASTETAPAFADQQASTPPLPAGEGRGEANSQLRARFR